QLLFERVHVACPGNLGSIGKTEDEVAEGALLCQQSAKVAEKCWRALLQKSETLGMGARPKLCMAGMKYCRNVRHQVADHVRKFESRVRRLRTASRELHIGDDRQQVVTVVRDLPLGIFIIGAQQNFR